MWDLNNVTHGVGAFVAIQRFHVGEIIAADTDDDDAAAWFSIITFAAALHPSTKHHTSLPIHKHTPPYCHTSPERQLRSACDCGHCVAHVCDLAVRENEQHAVTLQTRRVSLRYNTTCECAAVGSVLCSRQKLGFRV